MRYFSYEPDTGFEEHETEKEAREAAEELLAWYRDEASNRWDENVTGICWGEIKQCIIEVDRRPVRDGDMVSPAIDEIVDYRLVDAGEVDDENI